MFLLLLCPLLVRAVGQDTKHPLKYAELIKWNMMNKLNDSKYSRFVDKDHFKRYCAFKNVKTVENLAVYDMEQIPDIDFLSFPPSFVIKSSKGSSRNIIVRNGHLIVGNEGLLNESIPQIRRVISTWDRPYRPLEEPQYEFMKSKILIEKYIDPIPDDIGFFILNHEIDVVVISIMRNYSQQKMKYNFYDPNLNILPYKMRNRKNFRGPSVVDVFKKNRTLWREAKRTALKLGRDVDLNIFRVDLFLIDSKIYGSELTLSPCSGGATIESSNFFQNQPREAISHDVGKRL